MSWKKRIISVRYVSHSNMCEFPPVATEMESTFIFSACRVNNVYCICRSFTALLVWLFVQVKSGGSSRSPEATTRSRLSSTDSILGGAEVDKTSIGQRIITNGGKVRIKSRPSGKVFARNRRSGTRLDLQHLLTSKRKSSSRFRTVAKMFVINAALCSSFKQQSAAKTALLKSKSKLSMSLSESEEEAVVDHSHVSRSLPGTPPPKKGTQTKFFRAGIELAESIDYRYVCPCIHLTCPSVCYNRKLTRLSLCTVLVSSAAAAEVGILATLFLTR